MCRDQCKRCSFPGISCCSNRKKSCWPGQMAATGWPHSTQYSSPFLFLYIFHFLKPARPRQRQPSARDKLTTASLGNYYIQFGRNKIIGNSKSKTSEVFFRYERMENITCSPWQHCCGKGLTASCCSLSRVCMTRKVIIKPAFQGSWLALQVVGGTLASLLILVIAVALGSRFFGQQGPPHLPSNVFQILPVPSAMQFLRGQNSGGGDEVSSSSSTLPPPPPSSILYPHDDGLPVACKPSKPQVAWN